MSVLFSAKSNRVRFVLGAAVAGVLLTMGASFMARSAQPNVSTPVLQVSQDTFSNQGSQHQTQVEPAAASFGNAIVTVTLSGRFDFNGGASDNSWATSKDGGKSWNYGNLPGLTKYTRGTDPYDRVSDPSVAYDAKHATWLIESLPIVLGGGAHPAMAVNRSPDGLHWSAPVSVGPNLGDSDKSWIACDNWTHSPNYGHCYATWDSTSTGLVNMSTSTDGGLTWGAALNTADSSPGQGGEPQPQPNGTVVVPFFAFASGSIGAFSSTDGGNSWGTVTLVAPITHHFVNGGLRALNLPGSGVDGSGRVYVIWADCSFRSGCNENDIVMSTSTNGTTWTTPVPIPIDPPSSTVDHFNPGFAVDPNTKGNASHLALTYWYYTQTNCGVQTCRLHVGIISSKNSGVSWSAPVHLAGPMMNTWLPATSLGFMVGEYMGTTIANGKAFTVFPNAGAPSGQFFDQALFANQYGQADGFAGGERFTPFGMKPVFHRSDRKLPFVPVPTD